MVRWREGGEQEVGVLGFHFMCKQVFFVFSVETAAIH